MAQLSRRAGLGLNSFVAGEATKALVRQGPNEGLVKIGTDLDLSQSGPPVNSLRYSSVLY